MTGDTDGVRTGYDGVVYDLDGTLVRLAVDWAAAAEDAWARYQKAGVHPDSHDLWNLMESAPEHGLAAEIEGAVAAHEHDGARDSRRLPLADELVGLGRPAAVCSLNCERACEIALDRHDLTGHVGAVVGRDSVDTHKPDPEPLLAAIDRIGLAPDRVVFVGDSERDAVTAERAGVDFAYVDGTGPE